MENFQDHFLEDFTSDAFRHSFRLYFDELKIPVTDWEGLFRKMDSDGRNNRAFLRMNGDRAVGFLQFCELELNGWFFTKSVGFVREFWIAPEFRRQGHGLALLRMAEEYFAARHITSVVLTTDTAPAFYEKNGYRHDPGFTAKNGDPVYMKHLFLHDLNERMDYHDKTL